MTTREELEEEVEVDDDEEDRDVAGSVSSSGGGSRIIVSIESEPHIDRFARLNLHDMMDGGEDADDDMTPVPTDERNHIRAFDYEKLEDNSARGRELTQTGGQVDVDNKQQQQEHVEGEQEDDDDTLMNSVEEVVLCASVRGELLSAKEDTRSDCASEVRTMTPDVEEGYSGMDFNREIQLMEANKDEYQEQPHDLNAKELTEALLHTERRQVANRDIPEMTEESVRRPTKEDIVEEDYLIESPGRGQSVETEDENHEAYEKLTGNISETELEMEIIQPVNVEVTPPETSTKTDINSFLNSERSEQLVALPEAQKEISPQSFIDHEIAASNPSPLKSPPIITNEESSATVIDEDISDYKNFISIMQNTVLKERVHHFPLGHVNKVGDFPKTMSEMYTFEEEDMTDHECKKLQMRKRQESIKTKILIENTTMFKSTGHHRRYNMPAHSIDMGTRVKLSNLKMEEERKVFPRNRQIFIPGNFPRNIFNEQEYNLRQEGPPEPAMVRVKRITYTQPTVQLTMIREEPQPTNMGFVPVSPAPPSASVSLPPLQLTSQSVPATPQGLQPNPIGPLRRSRSVSPFIVDRDDPMMTLLADSMEIPLVHDGSGSL